MKESSDTQSRVILEISDTMAMARCFAELAKDLPVLRALDMAEAAGVEVALFERELFWHRDVPAEVDAALREVATRLRDYAVASALERSTTELGDWFVVAAQRHKLEWDQTSWEAQRSINYADPNHV